MFSLMSDDSRAAIRKAIDYARREIVNNDNNIVLKISEILVEVSDLLESDNILSDLNEKILTVRKLDGLAFGSIDSYHFLERADNSVSPQEYIQYAVSLLYLYLSEYQFRANKDFDISFYREFYRFERNVERIRADFFDGCQRIFKFADNIGYWVFREEFHSEHAIALSNAMKSSDMEKVDHFVRTKDDSIQKIEEWEKSLSKKIEEVNTLQEKLINHQTAFNFIGLYDGFKSLKVSKDGSLFWRVCEYYFIMFMMVSIPLIEISIIIYNIESLSLTPAQIAAIAIPTATLLILLFYFLKVVLIEVRSIRSQIMQLELRMTLCQFIQNYADTSKELKEKNKEGFEKFESLIFSSIVSSDEKIPSTFDGMDQLTNLLKVFQK